MSSPARSRARRWVALRAEQETAVSDVIVAIVAADPDDLTVAEVAARAGISRQTFYKQFTSLEHAVALAHQAIVARLGAEIERMLGSAGPPVNHREGILRVFEALFDIYAARSDELRFTTYYDFTFRVHRMSPDDRQEHPLAPVEDGTGGMVEAFEAGQREGSIDPSLSPVPVLRALTTSLLGVIQRLQIQDDWTDGHDEAARDTYAAMIQMWRTALAGAAHPDGRPV